MRPRYYYQHYQCPKIFSSIEAECWDTPTYTTKIEKSQHKGTIFGWGALTILLMISSFCVNPSAKVNPVTSQETPVMWQN